MSAGIVPSGGYCATSTATVLAFESGAVTPKHEVNQEAEHEIWYQ